MPLLTIGQLAKLSEVSAVTIRFYEKNGLISKGKRLLNGYRSYTVETAQEVKFIKKAQLIGFSLAEIADLRLLQMTKDLDAHEVKNIIAQKIELIHHKITALKGIQTELEKLNSLCCGKVKMQDCPILKALNE